MSAPADRFATLVGRWLKRAPAAVAGLALDAAVDSLELGKRAMAWLSHAAGARLVAVAALVVVVAGGAAVYHYRQYRRVVAADALAATLRNTSCASCRCRTDTDRCAPPSPPAGRAPA